MEQFVYILSMDTEFFAARSTQKAQGPAEAKLIHIFEEREILSDLKLNGKGFIQLLKTIEKCENWNELKEILNNEENKATIKTFSPLMHKYIQDLKQSTLDEMKKKCCCILIPAE